MQKNEAKIAPTIETLEVMDERNNCETRTTFICNQIVDRIVYYAIIIVVLYVVCMTANSMTKFMLHSMKLEEKAFLHKHLRRRNSIYLIRNW